MPVSLFVPGETREHEKRVALVPSVASKLAKMGIECSLQSGAGQAARIPDSAYEKEGVKIASAPVTSDLVFSVQPPTVADIEKMAPGTVLCSFIYAHREPEVVKSLRDRQITCFAMELVLRITRAQAIDSLSSQAALTGYSAGLMAATSLNCILRFMTTAVGSLCPAKVLFLGGGVTGLKPRATAKRLGAMIEGYDVRAEVKEQVESVGGKFVDTGVSASGEGGYARELTDEEKAQVEKVITRHIQQADAVITTAAIP